MCVDSGSRGSVYMYDGVWDLGLWVSERGRFHVARRLCKCVNSNDVFIIFIHFVSFVFPYLRMDGFVCSSSSP